MSETVPVAQLRAFVERIERIEADIKDLNADKSEVYKELRGCGFDVKAVRAVVAKRKLDTADREERDAMFDLYWSALNGPSRVHVHEARSCAEEMGRGEGNQRSGSVEQVREVHAVASDGTVEPSASAPAERASDESSAPLSEAEPFEPVAFLRQPKPLRPNCLHPDNCGGYGPNTCHSCKVAAAPRETVGA